MGLESWRHDSHSGPALSLQCDPEESVSILNLSCFICKMGGRCNFPHCVHSSGHIVGVPVLWMPGT